LYLIQAAPQVVLFTIYGDFADQVACFSCIFLYLLAKVHIKCCSVRKHNRFTSRYFSLTVASVYFQTVEINIKHQRKILASLFQGGGHGLILAALLTMHLQWYKGMLHYWIPETFL